MKLAINGESREFQDGIRITDLLNEMHLPSRQVAVEVNLQLVPRSDYQIFRLSDGDQLELVTLAGGG